MATRTTITSVSDLYMVKMFNPPAAEELMEGFYKGKLIEKVESNFSDDGADYVEFTLDGKVIINIKGY